MRGYIYIHDSLYCAGEINRTLGSSIHGIFQARVQWWIAIAFSGADGNSFSNTLVLVNFPDGSDGKAADYNARDWGLISGLGRSPGEGKSNPLQSSCLENLMDGGTG